VTAASCACEANRLVTFDCGAEGLSCIYDSDNDLHDCR